MTSDNHTAAVAKSAYTRFFRLGVWHTTPAYSRATGVDLARFPAHPLPVKTTRPA